MAYESVASSVNFRNVSWGTSTGTVYCNDDYYRVVQQVTVGPDSGWTMTHIRIDFSLYCERTDSSHSIQTQVRAYTSLSGAQNDNANAVSNWVTSSSTTFNSNHVAFFQVTIPLTTYYTSNTTFYIRIKTTAQYYAGKIPIYSKGGYGTGAWTTSIHMTRQQKSWRVYFNANGGSSSKTYQDCTITSGSTCAVTAPTAAQCTRANYDLLGWSASASATAATYSPGASISTSSSVTFYAVWKIKGAVWIYSGGWQQAIPYIYSNGGWHQAIPYVYSNGGWHICG